VSIVSDALRGIKWLKALRRIEDAWKEGAMAEQVSKTKLGTVVTAIAGLCGLFLAVQSGQMDLINAIVAAVGIVGGVVAVFGGRDAASKVITAIREK